MNDTPATSFRLATEADAHLPTYDNTKLVAMNTCPTYGVLRYQMHRAIASGSRSMPLECGHAMHEVFSWVRLCTLWHQLRDSTVMQTEMYHHHGARLFGRDRFSEIHKQAFNPTDMNTMAKAGAVATLDTSGYYDDPRDKRRTLSNMEECALAYVDRWRWEYPVWVRDPDDWHSDCGIEIPFDLVVDIEGRSAVRFTGRIDGIHYHRGVLTLQENKTASRLNDAWEMSFNTSHQVTGYCMAATVFTQDVVSMAYVIGLAIPLPRSYEYGGFVQSGYERRDHHYKRWIEWMLHTVNLYEQYENNPEGAPRYTHSCNRYYRPCQFVPFCDADDEEERRIIEQDMIVSEWSPLAKVTGDIQEEG